jgi:NADH-quinone oxidoreductase subunit B
MGLTADARGPLVAPAPRGILDPNTGKPVGADDRHFLALNEELSDKGFWSRRATTSSTGPRTGSLMWMTFGSPAARSR